MFLRIEILAESMYSIRRRERFLVTLLPPATEFHGRSDTLVCQSRKPTIPFLSPSLSPPWAFSLQTNPSYEHQASPVMA